MLKFSVYDIVLTEYMLIIVTTNYVTWETYIITF